MHAPLLLHVFPTFAPAGSQMRTVRVIEGLGDRYRHLVVSTDGDLSARDRLAPDAPVEVEQPPRQGTLRRIAWFRSLIERRRPAALLTYNWGSFDAVIARASFPDLPHAHHEDGFNRDEARRFKRRRILARRFLLRRADAVVVCSHTLERLALDLWRLPQDKVLYVPNGIDVRRYGGADRGGAREALGLPRDAPVVGSVGHLRPVKNYPRLVEAVARASPEAHVLLVGEGPERDAVRRAADRLGMSERLHLPGHRDDLPRVLAAMDVFALSSDSEQHPVSLLEAMAASLPAAATDVGDVRAVLPPEQHPFVVPPEGSEPLASAIAGLLALPTAERAALGAANRRRVEREFSLDAMLVAYGGLYERLVARSSGRPS